MIVGFSQGACLALTWLSAAGVTPGAVVAMTGAHTDIGGGFSGLSGVAVHLSGSAADPWVPADAIATTAAALSAAGADVHRVVIPGATHTIHDVDRTALSAVTTALLA